MRFSIKLHKPTERTPPSQLDAQVQFHTVLRTVEMIDQINSIKINLKIKCTLNKTTEQKTEMSSVLTFIVTKNKSNEKQNVNV